MATLLERVKKLEAVRAARAAASKDIDPTTFATRWMQLVAHAEQIKTTGAPTADDLRAIRAAELFYQARDRMDADDALDHTDLA